MNPIGAMDFLWLKLRRVPRWAWISGGLVILLVPALLMWLLFTLIGSAWQSGSALLVQEREALQSALPSAIRDAQHALPEAAAALRQLTGAAQSEVDAAISDARQAVPEAAAALRLLADAAQTEVDAAVRDVKQVLPTTLPEALPEAAAAPAIETTTTPSKD